MLNNFRTYGLAVTYYKSCASLTLPRFLKDQLNRASSSIVLNLAEGSAKPTAKERARFYAIAFASLRETQSIQDLSAITDEPLIKQADHLGACLYKLSHPLR